MTWVWEHVLNWQRCSSISIVLYGLDFVLDVWMRQISIMGKVEAISGYLGHEMGWGGNKKTANMSFFHAFVPWLCAYTNGV